MNYILSDLFVQGFAAFAGAFFAFFFTWVAKLVEKAIKRQTLHFNALVKMENLLNENIGVAHDNIYICKPFISAISRGNVYYNNLKTIPKDKQILLELHDTDMINRLFSYYSDIRKMNDDIETLTTAHALLTQALMENNMSLPHYTTNAQILAHKITEIEAFLLQFQTKTLRLQARVRIQLRKDMSLWTKVQRQLIQTNGESITDEEVEAEYQILIGELSEIKQASRTEIREALEQHNLIPTTDSPTQE